jgi:hypothetical protein
MSITEHDVVIYLCGGGTHPWGGVMDVSGRTASSVARNDRKRGRKIVLVRDVTDR